MFTGLVEEIGVISHKQSLGQEIRWGIQASPSFLRDTKIGDSIAVAGVCQTITQIHGQSFFFDSSFQTVQLTTLVRYNINHKINIEKALKVGDFLGGHFVYGHIEHQGEVSDIKKIQSAYQLTIRISESLYSQLIPHGSIAVDGVSLTIANIIQSKIMIQVIPHTWESTTLSLLKKGDKVNIEPDMFIQAQRLRGVQKKSDDASLMEMLKKNGFI